MTKASSIRSPSWVGLLVCICCFVGAVRVLAESVPLFDCPACEGAGRFSTLCPFCDGCRLTVVETDAVAAVVLGVSGRAELGLFATLASSWLMLSGVLFILTRARLLRCTQCRYPGCGKGLGCNRCKSRGRISLVRLWKGAD